MKIQKIKHEEGLSLIETIVALGIVSIIVLAFLSGLNTSFRGKMVQGKAAVGQAIATSQMEYIKKQPFSDNEWMYTVTSSNQSAIQLPSWWNENNPPLIDGIYQGYYAESSAEDFDFDGDGSIEVPGDDDSIRKIAVNVFSKQDELQFSLIAYKTDK